MIANGAVPDKQGGGALKFISLGAK